MFDPYHKWLGIPPGPRPPTFYQLLGISPVERDVEVIEESVIRQMTHLRTYQTGPYAQECALLLNEVAEARIVLRDPVKRAAYDASLASQSPENREREATRRAELPTQPFPRWAYIALSAAGAASVGLALWVALKSPTTDSKSDEHAEVLGPVTSRSQQSGALPTTQPTRSDPATQPNRSPAMPSTVPETPPRRSTQPSLAARPADNDLSSAKPAPDKDANEKKEPAKRLPVPDAGALAKSEPIVKETYSGQLASASSGCQRLALAEVLHKQALVTRDDPAARFVLLRVAGDLAAQGGNYRIACGFIEALAKDFEIDEVVLNCKLLAAAEPHVTANGARDFTQTVLRVAMQAIAADRFGDALRLAQLAEATAPKCKDATLTAAASAAVKQAEEIAREYEKVKVAIEVLREQPGDSIASLAVGKFLTLRKGDWKTGLPLLAQGYDEKLKAAAEADLAQPTDPSQQVKVADAWWELADGETGRAKEQLLSRALEWYVKAHPGLAGLNKAKAEKRIADAELLGIKPKFSILYAIYGADEKWVDVTARLQRRAKMGRLVMERAEDLGVGDPIFGKAKSLIILYENDGLHLYVVAGHLPVQLPSPSVRDKEFDRWPSSTDLTILYAGSGTQEAWEDITEQARKKIADSKLSAHIKDFTLGDPAFGRHKVVIVLYSYAGRIHLKTKGHSEKTALVAP